MCLIDSDTVIIIVVMIGQRVQRFEDVCLLSQ